LKTVKPSKRGSSCWVCTHKEARKWLDGVLGALEQDPEADITGVKIGEGLIEFFGYPHQSRAVREHLNGHTEGRWGRIKGIS